jgi:NTP pyrophosphatase (non-canonical NTP hydrolase)
MKTLQELQPLIINWAKEKGINNVKNQHLKLIEECGELAKEIITDNKENQKNEIGDIFVVLIILADLKEERIEIDLSKMFSDCHLECYEFFEYIIYPSKMYYCVNYLYDVAVNLNHDLTECANIAWEKIKNRKGTTKNGSFIKN